MRLRNDFWLRLNESYMNKILRIEMSLQLWGQKSQLKWNFLKIGEEKFEKYRYMDSFIYKEGKYESM